MPDPIRVEKVCKTFGSFSALDGVSLALRPGQLALLAGSNGAGKTSLIRLMAGLGRPTSGRIFVHGADPARDPETRGRIGFLSHQTMLYDDLTAAENLQFAASLYGLSNRVDRVLQKLDNFGLSARSNQPVRTFSRGMKQRLALARAILHDPALLLLDEPFTGLDQLACDALTDHLQQWLQGDRSCVIVTHRMEVAARLASHLFVLQRGRVCHDGVWSGDADELRGMYRQYLEERL